MKTTKLMINLLLLLFISLPITAQFGYETIEDGHYLKGPVYLYKKTVLKDYTEKFGEYEAGAKQIIYWNLYDKEGRKIYEYEDKTRQGRKTAYQKDIYFFDNDKLIVDFGAFTIGEKEDDFDFTFYQYPQKNIMEEYFSNVYDGKKTKGSTKKFNSKNLLIEESKYIGNENGYKKLYKYNSKGEKVSFTKYNGIGDLKEKVIYKRNDYGNLLEEKKYDAEGKLIEKEISKYNNAGKLIEKIGYNSSDNETFSITSNYLNDTLQINVKSVYSGKTFHESKHEYDNEKRLIKIIYPVYYGDKTNRYSVYNYDNNDNVIEIKNFENQKLIEKTMFTNYVGSQHLLYTNEIYNSDGSIDEIITEKHDKYGNSIAYEKYKYITKFGEKKKIPVEKHEIDIAYHDGTPKLEVSMKIVEEKHKNSKGKKIKGDFLHIDIINAKVKPVIWFFDKPGITKYGGDSKKYERVESYRYSAQYSYIKSFFRPYFIVEAGNEIIVVKVLDK